MILSLLLVIVAASVSIQQRGNGGGGGGGNDNNFVSVDSDNLNNGDRDGFGDPFASSPSPTPNPSSTGEDSKAIAGDEDDEYEISAEANSRSTAKPSSLSTSRVPTFSPLAAPTADPIVNITTQPVLVGTPFPSNIPTESPTVQPTIQPSALPTRPIVEAIAQTKAQPSSTPTGAPTDEPTGEPTGAPTDEPTVQPSPKQTNAPLPRPTLRPPHNLSVSPSISPTPSIEIISSFYVLAGRFGGPSRQTLKRSLLGLPSNNSTSFLIHLGDSSAATCTLQNYVNIRRSFDATHSPSVPVIFLPGESDYVRCPNPELSWSYWIQTFRDSENDWADRPFNVLRQNDENREENFAFVFQSILHVGLNMIGTGTNRSQTLQQNFEWLQENVENNIETLHAVVIYANNGLDGVDNDNHDGQLFFDPLRRKIGCDGSNMSPWSNLRFIYVEDMDQPKEFPDDSNGGVFESVGRPGDCPNFISVFVQSGIWPPLKVDAFYEKMDGILDGPPLSFKFDQNDWYDQINP